MDCQLDGIQVKRNAHCVLYVKNQNVGKPRGDRAIAWLAVLGHLADQNWCAGLNSFVDSYENALIECECLNADLAALDLRVESIVARDLRRSAHVFPEIMKELGLSLGMFPDAERAFRRLFIALTHRMHGGFRYFQGFDRLSYLCVAVAVDLGMVAGLTASQIEGVASGVVEALLSRVALQERLMGPKGDAFLASVTVCIFAAAKGVFEALTAQGIGPSMYAMNWLLSLFTDVHSTGNGLLLLDQIIDHHRRCEDYLIALVAAHLDQVKLGPDSSATLRAIMNKANYDVRRVMVRAAEALSSVGSWRRGVVAAAAEGLARRELEAARWG